MTYTFICVHQYQIRKIGKGRCSCRQVINNKFRKVPNSITQPWTVHQLCSRFTQFLKELIFLLLMQEALINRGGIRLGPVVQLHHSILRNVSFSPYILKFSKPSLETRHLHHSIFAPLLNYVAGNLWVGWVGLIEPINLSRGLP